MPHLPESLASDYMDLNAAGYEALSKLVRAPLMRIIDEKAVVTK